MTRTIQNTPKADLGLVPTGRLIVQLSQQELDAALAAADEAADLADALWRIVSAQPPAGTVAAAQREARLLISAAPLASLIPRGALNPAGPVPVAPASDDALANVQAECQLYALHKSDLAVTAQLDRIRDRFAASTPARAAWPPFSPTPPADRHPSCTCLSTPSSATGPGWMTPPFILPCRGSKPCCLIGVRLRSGCVPRGASRRLLKRMNGP